MIWYTLLCLILSGCTYSINMIHTQGQATDVVDENLRSDADVTPTFSTSASAI